VIVAPGFPHDVTAKIVSELGDDLRELDTGVAWRTELAAEREANCVRDLHEAARPCLPSTT
jgi:hypothetical protein